MVPATFLNPASRAILPVLLGIFVGFQGCTSLQWRDRDGTDHHLGFLAIKSQPLVKGTRVHRISFGLDLRITPETWGYSAGYQDISAMKPEFVLIDNPEKLAEQISSYLKKACRGTANQEAEWKFFYHAETASQDVTFIEFANFGLGLWDAPTGLGISLGYVNSKQHLGRALSTGIVQIRACPGENEMREEFLLWQLAS